MRAPKREDYRPASLGPIDYLEFVSLLDIDANRVDEYMLAARDAPCYRASGDEAQAVARLWRELRVIDSSEQMRCHTPPVGLRLVTLEGARIEASVCWRCWNVYGEDLHFAFNPKSKPAQGLLAHAKRVLPEAFSAYTQGRSPQQAGICPAHRLAAPAAC